MEVAVNWQGLAGMLEEGVNGGGGGCKQVGKREGGGRM